jgi:hypothetical protein
MIDSSKPAHHTQCCGARSPALFTDVRNNLWTRGHLGTAGSMRSGTPPILVMASARVMGFQVAVTSAGVRSPATIPLPATPRPKATASSADQIVSRGCRVVCATLSSASRTPIAATDPRSPSTFPPDGTESMCEPKRIGCADRSLPSRPPRMLPAASMRVRSARHQWSSPPERSRSERNATASSEPRARKRGTCRDSPCAR